MLRVTSYEVRGVHCTLQVAGCALRGENQINQKSQITTFPISIIRTSPDLRNALRDEKIDFVHRSEIKEMRIPGIGKKLN